MDQQHVYSGGFGGLRLVQQQVDDQHQNFIMADDTQNSQQHIVYSPVKTNELTQMQTQHQTQYIAQDDSMGSQFLIQQSAAPQQVFYANLQPQNIIQQQNQPKLVLQPQKVVVQRAPDMITNNPNMTQLVDQQQTVQYNFQQQQIDQNHQIIIHQQPNQMKQAIAYSQQGGQIISQQPQYIQLQQLQPQNTIVPQGTKIIMPNSGNPMRYVVKPGQQQIQQIQQNQTGQVMQIQQQQTTEQSPQNAIKFRPRAFTPMKITRTIAPSQMQIQPQQQQQQQQSRPRYQARAIQPRLVKPIAQSPLQSQHQQQQQQHQENQQQQNIVQNSPQPTRILQANIGNRVTAQNINGGQQQQFIIVQQQGQNYLLPTTPNQSQQIVQPSQIVRTVINRKIESPSTNIVQQNIPNNNNGNNTNVNQTFQPQQNNAEQNQEQQQNSEQVATSTLIRKEGDCDDLEDSITATAISKGNQQPGAQVNNSMSNDDFRRRPVPQQQTPQRVGIVRPMMNSPQMPMNNRLPVQRSPSLQMIRQRTPPRPQFQQQHGMQHELVHERESAKMLVILDNGEQRLITFTLPRESCTVQELLEQVGIEVGAESNIECIENPGSEIDYIVKVGNVGLRDTTAMTKAAENHIRQQQAAQQQQKMTASQNLQKTTPDTPKSPDLATKLPPAKYVEGFYAVCTACGFSGADHAKCERCHRIFTDDVKTVRMPAQLVKNPQISLIAGPGNTKVGIVKSSNHDRKDQIEAIQKKHQMAAAEAQRKQLVAAGRGRGGIHVGSPMVTASRGRGRGPKKPTFHEIVTLSSDDETDSDGTKSHNSKNSGDKKIDQPPLQKKHFEPDIIDDTVPDGFIRLDVTDFKEGEDKIVTSLTCRTIRIGSYKFDSKDSVSITSKGIKIIAPTVKSSKDITVLNIQHSEVVKFVMHFSKQLSIVFIYTKPSCGRYVVEQLQMTQVNEKSPYYAPLSRNETQKKIILLTENIPDEIKNTLKSIFKGSALEEINNRDANELLVRSTGIAVSGNTSANQNQTADSNTNVQDAELTKLLTYPRGRGGITITIYDYLCLGTDNYLNDVIIDFYLKYIHQELLTKEQQSKTHIFSTFFYKRLTTMTKDQRSLTAAQKRHQRVQSWTKNVDLFQKDFIIVPINEQSHWFLAIICFPNLTEPHTMDTNQPIKLTFNQKKPKKAIAVQIGNTTITPLNKKDESIEVHDDQASERDEAEGDDSELGSNAESEDEEVVDKGQPVKVPSILIFDSLGGTSRARVVATLRDYLTCEYKAKYPSSTPRQYSKTSMLGCLVKAPQQQNFTDCGLFLLQYVEQFFKDPIKDFRIPIKTLGKWFPQDIVTRKREDVALLIKSLMKREGFAEVEIPNIEFPTKDGKIIEPPPECQESGNATMDDAFEDPEYAPSEEEPKENDSQSEEVTKKVYYAGKKRSLEKSENNGNGESSLAKTPKLNKKINSN